MAIVVRAVPQQRAIFLDFDQPPILMVGAIDMPLAARELRLPTAKQNQRHQNELPHDSSPRRSQSQEWYAARQTLRMDSMPPAQPEPATNLARPWSPDANRAGSSVVWISGNRADGEAPTTTVRTRPARTPPAPEQPTYSPATCALAARSPDCIPPNHVVGRIDDAIVVAVARSVGSSKIRRATHCSPANLPARSRRSRR